MLIWKIKVYFIYIYHTLVNLLSYKDTNKAIVKSACFLTQPLKGGVGMVRGGMLVTTRTVLNSR